MAAKTANLIRARAERNLGTMASFDAQASPPAGLTGTIGLYDAGGQTAPVWVTTEGLAREGADGWWVLPYSAIQSIKGPTSQDRASRESTLIRLTLYDGTEDTLEISGGHGRFCDSFGFVQYLTGTVSLTTPDSAEAAQPPSQ